jgi:hypothetical protein
MVTYGILFSRDRDQTALDGIEVLAAGSGVPEYATVDADTAKILGVAASRRAAHGKLNFVKMEMAWRCRILPTIAGPPRRTSPARPLLPGNPAATWARRVTAWDALAGHAATK